jgi:hypothetical protein
MLLADGSTYQPFKVLGLFLAAAQIKTKNGRYFFMKL